MNDRLRLSLENYDGKSTAILTQVYCDFSASDEFASDLIDNMASDSKAVVDGATWLIKHHLEAGHALSEMETDALVASTVRLTSWAACLHICQIVRFLKVTSSQSQQLADWAGSLHDHKRPFLRAWSLDALVALARQCSALEPSARKALSKAKDDMAASVRARARNLDAEMN